MRAHEPSTGRARAIGPNLAALLAQETELFRRQAELTRAQFGKMTPAESLAVHNRLLMGRYQIDEISRQIDAMICKYGLAGAP